MKILILGGHPSGNSFCTELAKAAAQSASQSGNEIKLIHLSDLSFDVDLKDGFNSDQPLEAGLIDFQSAVKWCDQLFIVHPLWWGSAPAKLKGLFDRALMPGFAFKYVEGKNFPEKLLAGKSAKVFITSDTPGWYLKWLYGNGWQKILRKQILDFCGFKPVKFEVAGPIRGSSKPQREKIIEQVKKFAMSS